VIGMQAVLLGSGGYHPNERRHTMSVMLPEIGVAFDAGTSFFRAASRLQTDFLDIFLSHAHLDHIAGLTYLVVPMLRGQLQQVRLHSNRKTLDAVREHLFAEPVFPLLPQFEFLELPPDVSLPRSGTLTHTLLKHPGGSIGYRVDWPDRSLAYITDTTADGSYDDFVRGVDLLFHECYFPDELQEWTEKTGHSCTTPVSELAKHAGVGKLVLIHIDPQREDDDPVGLETARGIFAETVLGEDLMEFEF
jgi:ribonuclease BN (tRNA processing enzyme)